MEAGGKTYRAHWSHLANIKRTCDQPSDEGSYGRSFYELWPDS